MVWSHEYGRESKHSRPYRIAIHLAFGLGMASLLALVFGYFVMLLWNGVLPHVTAARTISYWQAVGLLVLSRILVGGFSGAGGRHKFGLRHGRGSREEYERWWHEVGRQSLQNFSAAAEKPESR